MSDQGAVLSAGDTGLEVDRQAPPAPQSAAAGVSQLCHLWAHRWLMSPPSACVPALWPVCLL